MSDQSTNGESHGESHGEPDAAALNGELENGELENGLRGFEAVGQFLEADGWHPQRIEDNYVYRVYFAGQNGELACFAQLRVDLEQLLFYVVMPVRTPAERRAPMAEFITRANYGLRIGNFEMDFEDGEVRYKSSVDFEGETLSNNLMRGVIYPAVQTMDRYLPGLLSVIYGGKTPAEAVAEIEAGEPGHEEE
ncbi:MAG: YbjN domain-containing protein [Litorilinea sp.]